MTIDQMIAVLEAAKRGEPIQSQPHGSSRWEDVAMPIWAFNSRNYRVKPHEPRVRYLLEFADGSLHDLAFQTPEHADGFSENRLGRRVVEFREVLP